MEIVFAERAGYCFGVKRAMDEAEQYAECCCGLKKIYTYGPLIHNKEALKKLEKIGVYAVDNLNGIDNCTVLIRAHGVPPDIYEKLSDKQIDVIDCTCPYVKKIHNIVKAAKDSASIIIIGDRNHPEVNGIVGWAGDDSVVIDSVESARILPGSENKTCVVVQTTFSYQLFWEIRETLKGKFPNVDFCDTICLETAKRQKEAEDLSNKCDVMLVVGDKKSANTLKLFELCKKNCERTLFLETIYDLELNNFKNDDRIGITAGASTLPDTLKEVAQYMSELEKNTNETPENEIQNNEDNRSFEDLLNDTLVSLHTGDVVKGTVISVNNEEVSVNLGFKSDGIIERGEFSSDPSVVPSKEVSVGDTIEVYVLRVNDGEGNVLLSKKRLESQKNMEFVETAFENAETIEAKVIEVVKAGLIALYKGIRIFIPYSQVSNRFVEDISVYKGSTLNIKILELDKSKRRIVGGRKEIAKQEEEARRAEVFEKRSVGDKINGTVSRIVSFGAFVDLGGVDGLIHISQMTWGPIKNPKDILKEGQAITAIVLDVNEEKGKIALSLKDINEDPWRNVEEKYKIGEIIEGKVARLAPFGAFVELEEGVDGLVHISQISPKRIEKCEDVLKVGELINVKVIDLNLEKRKISLSKKEADFASAGEEQEEDIPEKEEVIEIDETPDVSVKFEDIEVPEPLEEAEAEDKDE